MIRGTLWLRRRRDKRSDSHIFRSYPSCRFRDLDKLDELNTLPEDRQEADARQNSVKVTFNKVLAIAKPFLPDYNKISASSARFLT